MGNLNLAELDLTSEDFLLDEVDGKSSYNSFSIWSEIRPHKII